MSDSGTSESTPSGVSSQPRSDARVLDRRSAPTPRFSRYSFLGGRRFFARRSGEGINTFVDHYGLTVWGLILWVALMNACDSFFTLLHLQYGAIEVNPFAVWMLSTGRLGFVIIKSVLITLPLVVLCMHKNFPLARVGLGIAAGTYTLLCAYHIWLL